MISALIALVGPFLVPALGGILSGIGINLVGLLSSGGGKVAVRVVPLAVKLAMRVMRGDDATDDARKLIGAADPKIVEQVEKEEAKGNS